MKIKITPNIDWNTAPFSMDNKISKEIRNALTRRFEVAIFNLRDNNRYNELKLEDGWVIKAKDDVTFILVPDQNEDLPNNADLKDSKIDAGALGAKIRKVRDKAFDAETYKELSSVNGLTIDPTTGKITYKVL